MPKIGAGLGGLNWVEVKAVIEKVATNHNKVDLYVVENYSPAKCLVKEWQSGSEIVLMIKDKIGRIIMYEQKSK